MQTIHIVADKLASAWMQAVKTVFFGGMRIRTEYDKSDLENSFDVTSLIEVTNPVLPVDLTKSINHRDGNVIHPADVYAMMFVKGDYVDEILNGVHDDQIGKGPSYAYTYHDRLFAWKAFSQEDTCLIYDQLSSDLNSIHFPCVNQLDYMVKKLKDTPYTRRAQGITWRPYSDTKREDCPCLQRIWVRVISGKLTFQASWRSRDLFRAFEANAVGMMYIQKYVADQLGVGIGPYVDFCNSLHIYGQRKMLQEVVQFFRTCQNRGELESEYAGRLDEIEKQVGIDLIEE